MKTFFIRFLRVPLSIASLMIMLGIMMAGMLSSCASYIPPPPTPAYYAYYPGACPTFGPAPPSTVHDIAWRGDSSDNGSYASAPLTVPGGSGADCLVPDAFFDHPPIYGPPYRTYGSNLYGPILYRP
jgi:hypothetical protein